MFDILVLGCLGVESPANIDCISSKLLFFVSGMTNITNNPPIKQNILYVRKRPLKPINLVIFPGKYVTINTIIQFVAVAKLVPYGLT